MSDATDGVATAVYDRNGEAGSGDLRFDLNVEASEDVSIFEIEKEGRDNIEIPYLELADGTNVPLNRRIFRPNGAEGESRYVLEVPAGEVSVAEASTDAGATAAPSDPVTAMAVAGDRDGLIAFYEGVDGIGPKKAESLAESAIDRVQ